MNEYVIEYNFELTPSESIHILTVMCSIYLAYFKDHRIHKMNN